MGHYSKECPNLLALLNKENVGSSTWRFFAKEKGKTRVHLIELMSEGQENVLMGLERSLKIPKDVVDVMAQTKWFAENTIHLDINVKRFKEMAKAPKKKKNSPKWRFGFQNFLISRDFGLYLVVKDVG